MIFMMFVVFIIFINFSIFKMNLNNFVCFYWFALMFNDVLFALFLLIFIEFSMTFDFF